MDSLPLSSRERQVIAMVLSEKTLKEMAYDLGVSDKSVSSYKKRALQKLGVTNDVALVKLAMRQGLEQWLDGLAQVANRLG